MKNRKIKNLSKKELLAVLNKVWGLLITITNTHKIRSNIKNAQRNRRCTRS